MSIETEVKAAEAAVVGEAKKLEGEAKKLEGEAVEEVKKVETAVVEEVKRVRVNIETEEKLALREIEAEYLRAQLSIRDLQNQLKDAAQKSDAAAKQYTEKIEVLVKKYTIDKAEYFFDSLENAFKTAKK